MTLFRNAEKLSMAKEGLAEMEAIFAKNTSNGSYLSGDDQPCMVDLHIFPTLERFALLLGSPLKGAFDIL